jgi:hypothetical protein
LGRRWSERSDDIVHLRVGHVLYRGTSLTDAAVTDAYQSHIGIYSLSKARL